MTRIIIHLRLAWWATWIYLPFVRLGLRLGLPLDEEKVERALARAVRQTTEVVRETAPRSGHGPRVGARNK